MTVPTPQEVLVQAADLLETVGWVKKDYGDCLRGYCSLGAVSQVIWGDPIGPKRWDIDVTSRSNVQGEALALLKKQAGTNNLAAWNDRHRTSKGIIKTFRKAAAK